jgi:hypothetical protein
MLARRLLLLAAVLMLLTAVAAGLAPEEQATEPPTQASTLPEGTIVEKRISAAPDSDSRVVVQRGDVLKLEVAGNVLDSVQIERLDRIEAIEPLTPARFELLAEAPAGVYPIRLVDADRRIGTIEITN